MESNCYPAGSARITPRWAGFTEHAEPALTNTGQGGGAPHAKLLEYCWTVREYLGTAHGRTGSPGRMGAATRGRRAEYRPREGWQRAGDDDG